MCQFHNLQPNYDFFFLYYVNKNRGYAEQKKRFGTALWRVRYRATEFGVLGSKKKPLALRLGKKVNCFGELH